jgi:tetratricopeptide (TPR) repeat protein
MELYQRELEEMPPELLKFTMDEATRMPFEEKTRPSPYGIWNRNAAQLFVGRAKELDTLEHLYQKGGVVLITGEIGAGKTQFIRHFNSVLVDQPRQFFISCRSEESSLPLQPLINLFREYITREDLDLLDKNLLNSLSVLIPDIIRNTSSVQSTKDWASREARMALFEAIHQLFITASRSSKILLILDDIHWSDLDTLEVLMYLARNKFFEKHGFAIFTTRTEIQNPQISNILLPESHQFTIPRITLGALSKNETGELARIILGDRPSEAFIQKLLKATGGNPLFITETLQSILDSPENLIAEKQENIPLAESVTAIILEKEENLSEIARDVLSAAAMCGMEFRYDILDQMRFCEPVELIHSLEELEEKRFIVPISSSGSAGLYSFIHSLIRDSLISRLSQARQCRLHEQIAKAMSTLKGTQNNRLANIIARHYESAGKPIHAFQYWVKAGQYARGLFSIQETFNAFEKADRIRRDFGQSIADDDLYDLYSEWGDLAYNVMDISAMDECYSAMYSAGEQTDNSMLIGAALSGKALPAILSFEVEKAMVLLEQSIQILDRTDNLYERITARSRKGIVLSTTLQNDKAIEFYQQAIDLGKGLPSQVVRQAVTLVQYQLSVLYCLMGWPEKAKATGKQGLRNAYLLISRPTVQSNVHMALAMAAYYAGNFTEAQDYIRHGLKIAETLQNQRTTTLIQIIQARIHFHNGRIDLAWNLAKKYLRVAEDNDHFENMSEAHGVRGDVFTILHNFPQAIHEYKMGCEHVAGSYPGMNCYYRLGYVTARNGDIESGLKILEEVIELSKQAGFFSITLPARYLQAIIIKELGDPVQAQEIIDEVQEEARVRGLSMIVFMESLQQEENICQNVDTSLAEMIISNLLREPEFSSGSWLELFAQKLVQIPAKSGRFDLQYFLQFLQSIKIRK